MKVGRNLVGIMVSLIAVTSSAFENFSIAMNIAIERLTEKWKENIGNLSVNSRNLSSYSDITGQCGMLARSEDENRLACNRPTNVKILYNVKVASDGITLYHGRAPSTSVANGLLHSSLPGIESVYHRTTTTFNLRVRRSKEVFTQSRFSICLTAPCT